jgi:putative oxidoreductase
MKTTASSLSSALLILLFIYAAMSKLLTFTDFKYQLYNQNFPHRLADSLRYILPAAELLAALLLCFARSRLAGLYLAFSLLAAFTLYIAMVLLHYWNRVPCSCGGILSHLSWGAHLIFNCAFLLLNLIAINLHFTARRSVT